MATSVQQGALSDVTSQEINLGMYAEVQKPSDRPPRPSQRRAPVSPDPDSDTDRPPPVPRKTTALLPGTDDVTPQKKAKKKKKKKKVVEGNTDPSRIQLVQADSCNTNTAVENQLYDGVILLQTPSTRKVHQPNTSDTPPPPPPRERGKPVSAEPARSAPRLGQSDSAQPRPTPQSNSGHPRPGQRNADQPRLPPPPSRKAGKASASYSPRSRPQPKVQTPPVPEEDPDTCVYSLARAIPESRVVQDQPLEPEYMTALDVDESVVDIHDSRPPKPAPRLKPPGGRQPEQPPQDPPTSVIVDRPVYQYLRAYHEQEMSTVMAHCRIQEKAVSGSRQPELEILFDVSPSADPDYVCTLFTSIYNDVKSQLVTHTVNVSDVDDLSKLQNDAQNKVKCLFFSESDSEQTVVCQIKDLSVIEHCINKRIQTSRIPLPAGYDIGGSFRIFLYISDITTIQVDGIVNAANSRLAHGLGVAKAIAEAAGPKLEKECFKIVKKQGDVPLTQVVKTTGGKLKPVVLHAVGPQATHGQKEDHHLDDLRQTFQNVILKANELGLRSVAIPPISSGVYAVPHPTVARAMYQAIINMADPDLGPKKYKCHELHLVDLNDNVLRKLLPYFTTDRMSRSTSGKQIPVAEVPHSEYPDSLPEGTLHRSMISGRNLRNRKSSRGKGGMKLPSCVSSKTK